MTVRELLNKLAQFDLAAEVLVTSAGVIEKPKVYEAQGYVMIDLDCKYKQLFMQDQVDIAEIMSEEE